MLWITNHPRTYKSLVPRKLGVEYFDGEPISKSDDYPVERLKDMNIVGVYVNITREEYDKLELGNPNKR